MAWNPILYCAICWQEFDTAKEHNTGSLLNTKTGNVRLDGICPGDIRKRVPMAKLTTTPKEQFWLALDDGEPIVI